MPRFQANRRILALLAAFFFVTTLYFCTTRLSAMDLIRQPLREAAAPAVRAAAGPEGDAAQAALHDMSRTEGEHMSHEAPGGGHEDAHGAVEADKEEGRVNEADSSRDEKDEAEEDDKEKDAKVLEDGDEKEKEKEEKEDHKEKEEDDEKEEEKKKEEEKQEEKTKEDEYEKEEEKEKDEEKEANEDGHDRVKEEDKQKDEEQSGDKAHEKVDEKEDQDSQTEETKPKDDQDLKPEEEVDQEQDSQAEKDADTESPDSGKQTKTVAEEDQKDRKTKAKEEEDNNNDDDEAQGTVPHGLLLHAVLPEKHVPTADNGKRLLIIGDIHGMLKPLKALLRKADFDPSSDHIISVGDMVNKGPSSAGVVGLLMKHSASAVRGNHEDRVLVALNASTAAHAASAPLKKADAQALETARGLSGEHVAWLEALPAILSIDQLRMHVVHAGMLPGVRPADQPAWAVMNMRTLIRESHLEQQQQQSGGTGGGEEENEGGHDDSHDVQGLVALDTREGEKWARAWNRYQRLLGRKDRWTVVYGHDARRGLREERYSIGLDTGCVKGGALTGMVVEAEEGSWGYRLVQVRCEDDDDDDDDDEEE